ncbi:MAG: hypothetical protein ABIH23_11210 [bacterium]
MIQLRDKDEILAWLEEKRRVREAPLAAQQYVSTKEFAQELAKSMSLKWRLRGLLFGRFRRYLRFVVEPPNIGR